jgi:hypothetical protein
MPSVAGVRAPVWWGSRDTEEAGRGPPSVACPGSGRTGAEAGLVGFGVERPIGPGSRSFRPGRGPAPPRPRRWRALGHRVDTRLNDSDALLVLALDNFGHGVGLIGEAARRRDASRLGDQVAGRDEEGRILPQLVRSESSGDDPVSAPRADPELSDVDCSDARFYFRGISLASAVLHVISDGTPMVVSRPDASRLRSSPPLAGVGTECEDP